MKTFLKVLFSDFLRIVLLPLRILRIKNNRILFTGLTGGKHNEYSCNPMYLCEYLLENRPGRYEILWAVSDPDKYRWLEKKGIRLVKHFAPGSVPALLTARVIVSNGSYAPWFPFRKGQYFINTWHGGGAYKRIENDRPDAGWTAHRRAKFCADNISLFVSSCRAASEKLIRGTFTYRGEIMEIGMPRNDFLVQGDVTERAEKVRAYYHIPRKDRIVLYAPTYRPGTPWAFPAGDAQQAHSDDDLPVSLKGSAQICLDGDALLRVLEEGGEKWHLLYRAHRYQEGQTNLRVEGKRVIDVSMYPDMQELLAAADMMVTDYSSNIWDYSFLKRPCFLYTPDLDEYVKKNGFYTDIRQWPFPTAQTQKALHRRIRQYDEEKNRERIAKHHARMGCAETGKACELLAERIAEVCGK